ncbi:uncharacterized protein [Epargyreus clarus]|uniref:uncharacterized protein n=1 Tax=Epargyreus clarus TaxID=520877 RepID=UPI003C30D294
MNLLVHLSVIYACILTVAATNSTQNVTDIESSKNGTKEILKASETADPAKVEIVKQIRRLNEDGSYTIGYEADDGTFKIESRDVQGNVKGTFGYIDQDGEIKRVTYTSSGDSTPVPVTTSTTPSTPMMVVRVNKTVSSTTRRPLATVVYPTRSSATTRGTVIQPIPRRRASSTRTSLNSETTTEYKIDDSASNMNPYKPKDDSAKTRTQLSKPVPASVKDDLIPKQTTTKIPQTVKPVYEEVKENTPENKNAIRRQLTETSANPHMVSLQQSMGDDSTDVYGSHLSLGTVRPLFTTTTPRARLVPIHSLVAARQQIHRQYQEIPQEAEETTVEASTGRVFDRDTVLTSTAIPVVHIPLQRDSDGRLYQQQPIYHRPTTAVQFRTHEYLRDNPGAAVPIGNQRPFLQYEYQNKVLDQQFLKESNQAQPKATAPEAASVAYDVRPVTRIIPIPVDERGVPIQGYQARFVNPYRAPLPYFQRYDPVDDVPRISAPVSTRDLKRLLHILILRQAKLQSLMDQMLPGPPYQPQPVYRQEYDYNRQQNYQEDDRYDYRYDQQYRQDLYQNQVSNYDNQQYESQRYVPRRRYTRPYDNAGSSSNHIEDMPEFLPVEVREALLLKMLMLAISPDYMPTPAPATEMTTAAPPRKQVRNVQILGEEGSNNENKPAQRH